MLSKITRVHKTHKKPKAKKEKKKKQTDRQIYTHTNKQIKQARSRKIGLFSIHILAKKIVIKNVNQFKSSNNSGQNKNNKNKRSNSGNNNETRCAIDINGEIQTHTARPKQIQYWSER